MPGQVLVRKLDGNSYKCDLENTRVFLNIMSSICREHKQHINEDLFCEQILFNCEKVRRTNKRKMYTLYHSPYTVVHVSEHSMRNEKNNGRAKIGIKM